MHQSFIKNKYKNKYALIEILFSARFLHDYFRINIDKTLWLCYHSNKSWKQCWPIYLYSTSPQTLFCIGVTLGHIMLQIPGGECHLVSYVAESAGGSSYRSLQGGNTISLSTIMHYLFYGAAKKHGVGNFKSLACHFVAHHTILTRPRV